MWLSRSNNIEGGNANQREMTNSRHPFCERHAFLNEAKEKGTPLTIVPAAFRLRRAGFLAQEAWERFKADETGFDATKLVPFYIKTQDVPET